MTAAERRELLELVEDLGGWLTFDQPLAEFTTWRIGGPAEALYQPLEPVPLIAVVDWARDHGQPLHILGNGSNLLCPDEGVPGVVVHLANHLAAFEFEGTTIRAEAGVFLPKLAREAASRGLSGLECVVGVPGTVGGGCVLNAGVPSGTLGEVLVAVEVLTSAGEVKTVPQAELELGHRTSRLQRDSSLVLSASLSLRPGAPAAIEAQMVEHMAYRRRTQPLSQPSCGSVFRRPVEGHPGKFIEDAGCKGLQRGQAQVSALHANWIVNLGGATAGDVRWLMDEIQRRVHEQFGVELVPEVMAW